MAGTVKISDWKICGTMGVNNNVTPETTVDATFRLVETINQATGLNNAAYNDVNKTLTFTTVAPITKMQVHFFADYIGNPKTYEFGIYDNGVPTLLVVSDKAVPGINVAPILDFTPGEHVLDIRQRSTDGGTALTVHYIGLTISREV